MVLVYQRFLLCQALTLTGLAIFFGHLTLTVSVKVTRMKPAGVFLFNGCFHLTELFTVDGFFPLAINPIVSHVDGHMDSELPTKAIIETLLVNCLSVTWWFHKIGGGPVI